MSRVDGEKTPVARAAVRRDDAAPMRTTLIAALIFGAFLAAATSAGAAVGGLTYSGCVADTGAEGCLDLPFDPFQQASSVALSPDGRSAYVSGYAANSISHLFRSPATGALALDGCLNGNGSQNCGDLPGSPLFFASDVAVSPDGRSVYVTAYGADAIAHFFREPGGQLVYDGCLANDADDGCVDLTGEPLEGASGVAVSPDGTSVYVAGATLARFAVNGAGGQIAFTGCLNNDGSSNCVDLPGAPLEGVNDVAVSPDGRSVYAVSFTGDAIGVLLRDAATGKLDWDGCLNDDGSDNCVNVPGSPLDGALGVAVSGDGRSVYVASAVGDALSHLSRDPATGGLAWVGCLNDDGSDNCADAPGSPLDYAADVAVSPDGRSVYAAAYESDAVTHAVRDLRTGRLSWGGSVDGAAAPLNGAQAVAVSPDGKEVLVGTAFGSAVVRFARELPAPAVPKPPGARPDTTAPAITRLAVTGRRLRYTLSERAAVTIKVARCRKACRVKRTLTRAGVAGANRVRIKLRPGRYRARLVAADAAGNRSARATIRFRVRRR
jgi:DNA-binding beta-propeller fold protein YncE